MPVFGDHVTGFGVGVAGPDFQVQVAGDGGGVLGHFLGERGGERPDDVGAMVPQLPVPVQPPVAEPCRGAQGERERPFGLGAGGQHAVGDEHNGPPHGGAFPAA